MNKFYKAILILLVLAATNAIAAEDVTEFRGVSWGAAPASVQGLKLYSNEPAADGSMLYTRQSDKNTIGDAKVDIILYGFWHGKFFSGGVQFKSERNYRLIKDIARQKYGTPHEDSEINHETTWVFKSAIVLLSFNEFTGDGSLGVASTQVLDEQQAWNKKRAAEAKGEL